MFYYYLKMNSKLANFTIILVVLMTLVGAFDWKEDRSTNSMWAMQCDFHGNDFRSVRARGEQCASICARTFPCTHFSWNKYNGGTCWLKKGYVCRGHAAIFNNSYGGTMSCGIYYGKIILF